MPSIHLRGLSYAHTTATPVLAGIDLDLDDAAGSWVGVVGANGAGKTTLLRLLAGHLEPTAGSLVVLSDHPPLLVHQAVDTLTADVAGFATAWDGHARRLRSRLDLDPDDVVVPQRWRALSPGQRKRWQVAAALEQEPDVLLLDEPTNHLDGAAREHLLALLGAHRGLGLVVSHDRRVLDELTARTLRLVDGRADLHAGAYGLAAPRWRAEEDRRREEHARARREVERQRRILAEVRHDRHSAEAAPRRERRLAGASEPDAREAGRKFAQRKAEAALAARVTQLHARVDRAEAEADAAAVGRDHRGAVGFAHLVSRRPVIAEVTGDVAHAGGETWLRDVAVTLSRGDRVHLDGANGAGKTTLLRAVLDRLAEADETVAALPQELDDPAAELERLHRLDPAMRGRVLGTAARLGIDPDQVLASGQPSPGEARKLALAHLLAGSASVLVLDEPTNHLDLPAIEALQDALAAFAGAVVLVTHDDHLATATTSTVWDVAGGRVQVTPAGRSDG